MKYPTFAHGSMAKVKEAIATGKLKYPAYVWISDQDTYCFLNNTLELEECGIPKLIGTLEEQIIVSDLYDGIYEIKGVHKLTETAQTTFSSGSYIFYIVQTTEDAKKIKRITSDEITDYVIKDGQDIISNEIVTETYLQEHGYADTAYIDEKMVALEEELRQYVDDSIVEAITDKVEPIVRQVVDEEIQDVPDKDIEELFDE